MALNTAPQTRTIFMRRILIRGCLAATMTCGLLLAGPAVAGGTGMPWESPLQQIVQSVTGTGGAGRRCGVPLR
jgi:type IV secretory pathway VirB2 component (pilin)